MWGSTSSKTAARGTASGALLVGLFVAVIVLVFLGVYLVLPADNHFYALVTMGVLGLIVGFVSYLAEALSREPTVQRASAWGFGVFGFAVLFLSILAWPVLYPSQAPIMGVGEILVLVLLLVFVIIAVAGARWRSGQAVIEEHRQVARSEWASHPAPSAFSYATAQMPGDASSPPTSPDSPPMGDR